MYKYYVFEHYLNYFNYLSIEIPAEHTYFITNFIGFLRYITKKFSINDLEKL